MCSNTYGQPYMCECESEHEYVHVSVRAKRKREIPLQPHQVRGGQRERGKEISVAIRQQSPLPQASSEISTLRECEK